MVLGGLLDVVALIAIAELVDGTGPESKAPLALIVILAPVLVDGAVPYGPNVPS